MVLFGPSDSGGLCKNGEPGAYVNFLMNEGQDRIKASYRGNYDRLVQVKNRYDPDNTFRVNQNIRPTTRGL